MSAVTLSWRSMPYEEGHFFVKGTTLAQAVVPGTGYRFVVREVRGGRDQDGYPTLRYGLADAATVSDVEIRNGVLPRIVFWADEPEYCIAKALKLARL